MKIVVISPGENTMPGGVHRTVIETCTNLAKIGHEIVLIQTNPLNFAKEELYLGFKIIRISSKIERYFYGLCPEMHKFLKNNFKKLNPDIIHVHGYHTLIFPELIYLIKKIDSKIPILFSPHIGQLSHRTLAGKYLWNFYNMFIGKKFIKYPNIIFAASDFESKTIQRLLKVPENKIKIIPHGVNYIDLNQKQKTETINLLYVGYLLRLKGVQYILEALNKLIYEKRVKVYLRIVGSGPYETKLKNIATELNISKFIHWEGFVKPNQSKKLFEFYKKSDISLLLSESENYGIVVLESLALGTPCIVTKKAALNEFLEEPGCFGVDYPPNIDKLVELILKIHNKTIIKGQSTSKIMNWEEVSKCYLHVFEEIIGD